MKLFLRHLTCVFLPLTARNALNGVKSASYAKFVAWAEEDIGTMSAVALSLLFGLLLAIAGVSLYNIAQTVGH